MHLDEITRPPSSLGMAYSKRKAEQIVTGLEDPINQHLLKLLAFEGGPRDHWIAELDAWCSRIGGIVWTRTNRPFDRGFYRRILFDEPAGGVEERNVGGLVDLIARRSDGPLRRNAKDVPTLVRELRSFHDRLADAFGRGAYDPSLLDGLRAGADG
jgi:hypothetical protein